MLTTNGHAHTHSAYSTTCAERFCRMIALVSEPPKKEMERNRVVCARRARWWEAVDANIGAIRRNHTATTLSLALLNSLSRSISRFSENLWSLHQNIRIVCFDVVVVARDAYVGPSRPFRASHLLGFWVCVCVYRRQQIPREIFAFSFSSSSSFNFVIVFFPLRLRWWICSRQEGVFDCFFFFSSFHFAAATLAHHTLRNPFEAACSLRNIRYSLDALLLAQIKEIQFFFSSLLRSFVAALRRPNKGDG